MKPTIALVGRPNVGKSTLFNRLTRSRDAMVADMPGLTRDRHYGHGRIGDKPYLVVDTGGFEPSAREGIYHAMARQTLQAVDEADAGAFMVDGRDGLTPQDREIAAQLRKSGRPHLAGGEQERRLGARQRSAAEFHELGSGRPAADLGGARRERERADGARARGLSARRRQRADATAGPRIAVVGRPNVGKSTLVNALLGEERMIVFDQPGTTRDSIYVEFERDGKPYTLIDTAGVRRRGKVDETARSSRW